MPTATNGCDLPGLLRSATKRFRIVHNACIDELRRRPRRSYVVLDDSRDHADHAPGSCDVAITRSDLATPPAGLSPEQRAVVLPVDAPRGPTTQDPAAAAASV